MTKGEIIARIRKINTEANKEFILTDYSTEELAGYLEFLMWGELSEELPASTFLEQGSK